MRNEERNHANHLRSQLLALVQLEDDAIELYAQAIGRITDEEIRSAFEQFQADHRRHASELPYAIQHAGWATPMPHVDLKGHVEEVAVRMQCVTGTSGALHAMLHAEKLHNRHYSQATAWDVATEELADLLGEFADDERRHLEFIVVHLDGAATRAG